MKTLVVSFCFVVMLFCFNAKGTSLTADSGIAAQPLKNCKTDLRYLNQVVGWQVKWPRQWQNIVAGGPDKVSEAMVTWSQVPTVLSTTMDALRLGIAASETAPEVIAIRVQQQVADLASALTADNSPYLFTHLENKNTLRWNTLIKEEIAPAVLNFQQFLQDKYLPASGKSPGLSKIEGGEQCFFAAVTWWTTLSPALENIEAIGKQFLHESNAQLLATGKKGDTVDSMLADLRKNIRTNTTSEKELLTVSEKALARAHNKTLQSFSKQIDKEIVVSEMPKYLQASAPAGYYGRSQDNTPARYIINPSRPNERRLMAEVIAFHEGLPGHHLWSTYPREKASKGYNSGILEGWALYSEYLADEMSLYSTTYDRQGMITKHLWAASRLIVEPGLHIRGWSREKAINFMLNNTVMSRTEIEIEVDRYIAMPGQSLSYILGAHLILSERKRAKEILGTGFDIAEFHDVILASGVRPLPQVRDDIREWVLKTSEASIQVGQLR